MIAPEPNAVTMTRVTDSAEMLEKLRRKSTTGTLIAAEYRIGGSSPMRMSSCGTSDGAPGR
jgi:hypothetical protein